MTLADDDRDGVINQRDLCADTPEGVTVDIKGCANWKIVEDVEVLSVAFDFDKYVLKPEHTAVSQRVGAFTWGATRRLSDLSR